MQLKKRHSSTPFRVLRLKLKIFAHKPNILRSHRVRPRHDGPGSVVLRKTGGLNKSISKPLSQKEHPNWLFDFKKIMHK